MSYSAEVAKQTISVNVVAKIGDEYYARVQPDSGLVIPDEHLILDDPQINGTNLDIREVSTPVGGFTFKLKDEDEFITKVIMLDANNFLEKTVEVFVGFKTGSFDWADYKKVANTRISNITKITNGYSVKSKEVISLLTNPTYNVADKLAINILPVSLTLDLEDVSGFPTTGLIKINGEFIRYNGITNNTLENLTRGVLGTPAAAHSSGSDAYLVTELIDTNPIDMLLQLMLSKDGDLNNDPTYDVLPNGLGLTSDEVNIAEFEAVRDSYFNGEQFRLYMYNQNNTLKYIEAELLRATNCRIFSLDGKISISVLDQVDVTGEVPEINEDTIIGTPTWTLGSNKIVNVIRIKYDYDEATGLYNKSQTFEDQDSIDVFGRKTPLNYSFKGAIEALNGGSIVANRGERLLNRLSTPRGNITVKCEFDASETEIGANILLNHRFLPKQGAGLGIYDQLEVMSRSINLKDAVINLKLEYTSFTGIRVPFIAPSPNIAAVINQRTFEVPDGSCFNVGFALKLWNNDTNEYYPDTVNLIESIDGNVITMANDFTTILTTEIRIKMADYNSNSTQQRNRYASVGNDSGLFDDGTKSYQIIF